jgi:acyl CoA:acetate/3-ketoacid CoA transferase alpha subunit
MLGKRFFSNKVFNSTSEAIKDIKDGSFLMVGGFGVGGTPNGLITALRE